MSKTVLLTGPQGFLGQAIYRRLKFNTNYEVDVVPRSMDLRIGFVMENVLERMGYGYYDFVIHCAQVVKGIVGNVSNPATMLEDNVLINTNVAKACLKYGVGRLIAFGSTCMYPAKAIIPMKESTVQDGPPEPSNRPYAYAKRMQHEHLTALYRQYGFKYQELILANLYGPGQGPADDTSHVIPALIHKCLRAANGLDEAVTVWGTGAAQREFLFIEDAVDAVVKAMEITDVLGTLNVGSGTRVSVGGLYRMIRDAVGVSEDIATIWDTNRPNGQSVRLLDSGLARKLLFWTPATSLETGLEKTIESYRHCS